MEDRGAYIFTECRRSLVYPRRLFLLSKNIIYSQRAASMFEPTHQERCGVAGREQRRWHDVSQPSREAFNFYLLEASSGSKIINFLLFNQ